MPEQCPLTPADHAAELSRAFHDGFAAGVASRGGILDPCPGSRNPPSAVTRRRSSVFGPPYRGLCRVCGREYMLHDFGGLVRKHRRSTTTKGGAT